MIARNSRWTGAALAAALATVLVAAGTVLAFVNALLLGWGSSVWGGGSLIFGLVGAAVILPVFAYRHFVQDRGVFPDTMYEDLPASERGPTGVLIRRAGIRPYVVLAGGVAMVVIGQLLAAASG